PRDTRGGGRPRERGGGRRHGSFRGRGRAPADPRVRPARAGLMNVDVRVIPEEDRRRWFEVCSTAFSSELREEEGEADSKLMPPERMLGAEADGAPPGKTAECRW